jgi:hypothetical protein
LLLFGLLLMTLMIGLRFEVGADWAAYERMFLRSQQNDLPTTLGFGDPGYFLVNWLTARMGLGIWGVNLFCGLATVAGVAALTRLQRQPWLAVLVAIPYLIVVIAMGYTRQAAALGFMMIGLAAFLRTGSILRCILWIALAALFHKSAVVAVPLLAYVSTSQSRWNLLLVASASVGLYMLLLDDAVDALVATYIGSRYASTGAAVRISMCVVPALIFFALRRRLDFSVQEDRLWRNFSLLALAAVVALAITPSSTAVDRVALYLLPLQFVIMARLPGTIFTEPVGRLIVIAYTGVVLFTWLNFAVHARFWVPYESILWTS